MPLDALLNGAYDSVAGAPSPAASGTSLTVSNAARWPDPLTVGPYPITIWPTGAAYFNGAGGERAMVTAKTGAVLTIVRAIEGSTARTVVVGDQIAFGVGKQDLQALGAIGARNRLRNPGFWLAQRQAPATYTTRTDDQYGADGWNILTETGASQYQRLAAPAGFKSPYVGRLKNTSGVSQRLGQLQILESHDSIPLRGETVRFDFIAQCITSTQTLRYAILEWTGGADAVTSDVVLTWASGTYTAGNFFLAANLTIAAVGSLSVGAAALCSLRATISAAANNIIVMVWTEAAQANNFEWQMSDCRFDLDAVSEPFMPRPAQQELAICQRFYEKSYEPDTAPATATTVGEMGISGLGTSATSFFLTEWRFCVPKRLAPTMVGYDLAGNNGKITRAAPGGTNTNNITPSGGPQAISTVGFEYSHSDAAANYTGYFFHFTADCEL